MKFTRIELENIFAYVGEVVLDVGGTSGGPEHSACLGSQRDGKDQPVECGEVAFSWGGESESEINRVSTSSVGAEGSLCWEMGRVGQGSSTDGPINKIMMRSHGSG